MYCKRVLILQQVDKRFAQRNRELCGMVKLVNNTEDETVVTVFVANAATNVFGQWWLLLNFGDSVYVKMLPDLNNRVFSVGYEQQDNVGCVLVKRENKCFAVAKSFVGNSALCDKLIGNMESLVSAASAKLADLATQKDLTVVSTRETSLPYVDEDLSQQHAAATAAVDAVGNGLPPTNYEQFVLNTADYYVDLDINNLRKSADSRYKSVEEYSEAFDRFYASGSATEYYQSVKSEIGKLFVEFPPYFPLINKYADSFFVRIDFPSSERYFVFGVMQKNGNVRYICYGVPAEKDGFDDKDFVYVDNVPTPFWMLFQDADNGQITTLSEAL